MESKRIATITTICVLVGVLVGAFIVFMTLNDKKGDAGNGENTEQTTASTAASEEDASAEEEAPVEQPKRRARRNVASDFGRIAPIGQDNQVQEIPTKEEILNFAHEMLDNYRNSTDEEKMQMQMGLGMAQYVMDYMSANVANFIPMLDSEQRQRLLEAADASRELLDAIQLEMAEVASDEEIAVFGGAFQSMRTMNDSILEAAPF